MYQTDRNKQVLHLECKTYTPDEIFLTLSESELELSNDLYELFIFLREWFSESEEMTVLTSGSTGKPKPIRVRKQQMVESAVATCRMLDLKPGDKALLCLSTGFIAGKMMVIRSLVAGMCLYPVAPDGHPLQEAFRQYDFAAMVPMQIYNSLQSVEEKERLMSIGKLLVGGGPVSEVLEKELKTFPNAVYGTYGMTETLSHVALRRINGSEASKRYSPLPNVRLSLNESSCLVIDAPLVNDYLLITNDRAELYNDGTFLILGRLDNVINSGGIKIQAESLENFLSPFIQVPFAVSSVPDDKFGEIIVLVVEGQVDVHLLKKMLHDENLPAHEFPKRIVPMDTIPRTESGKINRKALRDKLLDF
jgi:o-succinylbenzoate---CoA ligase